VIKYDSGAAARSGVPAPEADRLEPAQASAVGVPRSGNTIEEEITGRIPPSRVAELAALVAPAATPRPQRAVSAAFTGRDLGLIPWLEHDDVAAAANRARAAQREWARRPWHERAAVINRFHDRLLARQDEVMDLVQIETGKTRFHAFAEVVDVALVARHYAYRGERLLRTRRRRGTFPVITQAWERRVPKGIIGILSTWNYPLTIAVSDALPALLAGNAVILKPDERTPFTALWCLEQFRASGLPEGLFQIVTGSGPVLGEAVIYHSDYVHFTGSTATGRKVAAMAAERLIGCSLELGGKNPLIVLRDADMDRVVEGSIQACFTSAGQLCVASESLYVHESRYEEFKARFLDRIARMKLGASFQYGMDMGSLVSRSQLEKVEQHVADAVAGGARVLIGGRARPDLGPWFYEPTVVDGARPGMRLHDEETFGPVVALYSFRDADEAVRLVNASPFGLNASVWTRRARHGRAFAARLQMGMVNINDGYGATWGSVDAPMGGVKASGIGRRHGDEGIQKYTEEQTVAVQRLIPLAVSPSRQRAFQRAATTFLRIARRVPGLR
jgi:succinate-semialdehyde dehydrogenase / glutarate-semialdehyde dehydrogenase